MPVDRIDAGTVAPGTIEFVMPFGGGETAARLNNCITTRQPVPRDLLDYINGAMGLMVPTELMERTWHVAKMTYRGGDDVTIGVVLSASS